MSTTDQILHEALEQHALWLDGEGGVRANLRGADLEGANLQNANLRGANLRGADLEGADLRGADLRNADLRNANLRNAYLQNVNLRNANLRNAYLQNADLEGADLQNANLEGADLQNANLSCFQVCPESGGFIAWKKAGDQIIQLYIPADAERTSCLCSRKCRASKALVLAGCGFTNTGPRTEYRKGFMVYPDSYDDDIRVDCSHGIHFFMTRREAEEW